MALFDDFADEELDETGIRLSQFGNAIQVWTWMQEGDKQKSVVEVARVFNTTTANVRRAVKEHPWMLLIGPSDEPNKQLIDHDGE